MENKLLQIEGIDMSKADKMNTKINIEEAMKECSNLAKEANWNKEDTERVITEYREMEAKAKAYDSLVEKIKDKLKEEKVEVCYFSDKDEEIAKRHAYTVDVLQKLLDTEKEEN